MYFIALPWLQDTLTIPLILLVCILNMLLLHFIHLSVWLVIFLSICTVEQSLKISYNAELTRRCSQNNYCGNDAITMCCCCYLLRFDLLAMLTADSSCRIYRRSNEFFSPILILNTFPLIHWATLKSQVIIACCLVYPLIQTCSTRQPLFAFSTRQPLFFFVVSEGPMLHS